MRPDAADGVRAVEVLRVAGGVHRRRPRHRPRVARRRPRPQRGRQDHPAADPGRASTRPDTGAGTPGHGLKLGYYAQEHETLDTGRTVLENLHGRAPQLTDTEARSVLGSFLFSGDDATKPAGVLSGGEKTRLALAILVVSSANVLLLDEPTNNLDPASRDEVLAAIRSYAGAIVLVTHDEGAVHALATRPGADPARRGGGPVDGRLRRPGGAGLSPPRGAVAWCSRNKPDLRAVGVAGGEEPRCLRCTEWGRPGATSGPTAARRRPGWTGARCGGS